jgi:hypothetical protein
LKYNPQSLRFGSYETWFDRSHNTVLDVLSMTGLIGFITYAGVFAMLFYSVWRAFRKGWIDLPLASVLVALPVAYFVQNLFVLDDFCILERAAPATEIRTIYESNAPVFAETSTAGFRATPKQLIWADDEGLWMRDSFGNSVLGINGYAPGLVERSVAYIRANEDVQKVIVYNDNGGDEVRKSGKYQQRLYTSPDFDWNQKMRTMNAFTGHYLVIDAPPVDQTSFFAKYFTTCIPVYQDIDKYMRATVYDCRKAPPIVL